jgi:hypothetical protein
MGTNEKARVRGGSKHVSLLVQDRRFTELLDRCSPHMDAVQVGAIISIIIILIHSHLLTAAFLNYSKSAVRMWAR